MSVEGDIISALRTQLLNYVGLSYVHDSGYEDKNIEALVQTNKFPFFNIISEGWETNGTSGIKIDQFERHISNILIQFAVRAMDTVVAKQGDSGHTGIYDFADDIWDAIRSDKTLGKKVNGYLPNSSVLIDIVEAEGDNQRYFIGGAEMRIKFYKDIGR
jgi:hypothetical protein